MERKPSQVFDWSTYSIQQREQGVYGVEAFVKLLERQLAGNAQYTKLKSKPCLLTQRHVLLHYRT